jgi:hypothetical protein
VKQVVGVASHVGACRNHGDGRLSESGIETAEVVAQVDGVVVVPEA